MTVASVTPTVAPTGSVEPSPRKTVRSMRQGQTTQVGTGLPPEVIQRISRQHFGQFLTCYEQGFKTNAKLAGRVTVKFVIDPAGTVSSSAGSGSDLPDASTVSCIVKTLSAMTFPAPEDKKPITVTYPLDLAPEGNTSPPPAPKPTK